MALDSWIRWYIRPLKAIDRSVLTLLAAFWCNRSTVHRVIPGRYKAKRFGTRTTVFGERPYFDPKSTARSAKTAFQVDSSVVPA